MRTIVAIPLMAKIIPFVFIALACVSCGDSRSLESNTSGSAPVLLSSNPAAASPGAEIILKGNGFSVVAQENIVSVAGASAVAEKYEVAGDGSESITFHVPATATPQAGAIAVVIEGEASNTIPFTINP